MAGSTMRVPYAWLREHCDPGIPVAELAERLAMTGTEVERVATAGPPSAEGFVVGRVLAADPHPDADRLRVCRVDVGDGERTIVCGAPNVAVGQTVAVALPGATMPGGERIGRARLRGVESEGMILSASELEIGEDSAGIIVLDEDLSPGSSLAEALPLAEPVLELEVTPNRVDCLGVYGVAREVHAITAAPLAPEPWAEDAPAQGEGEVSDLASVAVEVGDLCPRFTARVFTDVAIAPSPAWLQARLAAAGQRPINNVVDITNYTMLLTAQPLHAFDLERVPDGALTVRLAEEGETMTTLDGVERVLDAETVLVCDGDGPSGIAGIMGGQVLRGLGGHDARAARGRQLERDQHPAHFAAPGAALGCLLQVREAAASGALHAGAADRLAADCRALRGEARPGHDRRRSQRAGAATPRPARRQGRGPAGDGDPSGGPGRLSGAAWLRS